MTLRDYLRILKKSWMLIMLVTLGVIVVACAYTFTTTPQYQSTARLFVTTSQSDTSGDAYQGGLFSAQRVTSYSDLVGSRDLAETVIGNLDLDETPEELTEMVTAEVVPDTVNLTLTVTDTDPAEAQRIAQGYAEAMVELVRELETPEGGGTAPIKASIVDPADLNEAPVSPQPARNIALALVLGALLGVGIAVLRDLLDSSVTTAEDLAQATDAPLIGGISDDPGVKDHPLIIELESHEPRVEAFRVLRTNLQFLDIDHTQKIIVGTSALPEEGKTTTMVNLALAVALAGAKVLLIEGDLRRPRATHVLGMDSGIGVTTILLGNATLDDAVLQHRSGLDLLGAGATPPNPAELIQSGAMKDLLAEARAKYDLVLIDAPPLLPVTDAALLAAQADGALLVVRHGKTTHDQFAGAVKRLEQVGGRLLGLVFNRTPKTGTGYRYGYGYGYGPDQVKGGKRART